MARYSNMLLASLSASDPQPLIRYSRGSAQAQARVLYEVRHDRDGLFLGNRHYSIGCGFGRWSDGEAAMIAATEAGDGDQINLDQVRAERLGVVEDL